MNSLEALNQFRETMNKALGELHDAVSRDMNGKPTDPPAQTPPTSEPTEPLQGRDVMSQIIDPALLLLPHIPVTDRARAMLYAIGMQESRFVHREQITAADVKGPALGFWQFERGGGVLGVLNHRTSKDIAEAICRERAGNIDSRTVWLAIENDDLLAAVFARLLLWTDPAVLPVPVVGNEEAAWAYYLRNWRPGKPHRETWGKFWREACELVAA